MILQESHFPQFICIASRASGLYLNLFLMHTDLSEKNLISSKCSEKLVVFFSKKFVFSNFWSFLTVPTL